MKYIVECIIKDEDGLANDYIVVEADSEEDAKKILQSKIIGTLKKFLTFISNEANSLIL